MKSFYCFISLFSLALLFVQSLVAQSLVTYAGGSGDQRFYNVMELSDGTFLVCGFSDDLNWLPNGTPTQEINPAATNGSSIDNEGVNEDRVAFIARFSADLQTIQEVVHFPKGEADEIRYVKTDTAPNQTTGNLYISGTRGEYAGYEIEDSNRYLGGFFIAKLNNNFINGTPTGLEYVHNVPTHGKANEHGFVQPWDVMSDGQIITVRFGAHTNIWGEIVVYPSNPGTPATAEEEQTTTTMPGFRYHKLDDGSDFYGTMDNAPNGRTSTRDRMILKTQRTGNSGIQRSFTFDDYHAWEKDENDYWRKGKHPLDVFWDNYWTYPSGGDNNYFNSDTRGYTGYKLSGTGSAEGAPYTPRVGVITVDKRNDHFYIGYDWKTRLPGGNTTDFEPAFVAYDDEGYQKWWTRLYREYDDNGAMPAPTQYDDVAVTSVNGTTITANALVNKDINHDPLVAPDPYGGSGFTTYYKKVYWKTGANAPDVSDIESYNESTGAIMLRNAPANTIQAGDTFMVDAYEYTKTRNSSPDQYIDAIAIDYSKPLSGENNAQIIIGARAHGSNVSNLWRGDNIASNPSATTYHDGFTGTNGNIHFSWIGRLRDDTTKATLLGASYLAEFSEAAEYGTGHGAAYTDPNMDFWPSHNTGWPDINTTTIRQSMHTDSQGRVYIIAKQGRATLTTKDAYQRNIRPVIKGIVSSVASKSEFTLSDIAGANLITSAALKMKVTSNGDNRDEERTITDWDNTTGTITLSSPLPEIPKIGAKISIDEGVGTWNSFVRVLSEDLSSVVYSSLITSELNPVDGSGAGNTTELHGVWPVDDGVLVVGFHNHAAAWKAKLKDNTHTEGLANTIRLSVIGNPVGGILKVIEGPNVGFTATVTDYYQHTDDKWYTVINPGNASLDSGDRVDIIMPTTIGNDVPLDNVPSWGTASPTDTTALLARLDFTPPGTTLGLTYADWVAATNWSGETDKAADDDPDGDGITNFMEYAIDGNPIEANMDNMPKVEKNGSNYVVKIYLGRPSSEVSYAVEFSTDMSNWNSIPSQSVSGSEGQWKEITLDLNTYPQLFARLKTSQ